MILSGICKLEKSIGYNFCLFNDPLSNIFSDFCSCVLSVFSSTPCQCELINIFLLTLLKKKKIHVLLSVLVICHLKYTLHANTSCQIHPFSWDEKKNPCVLLGKLIFYNFSHLSTTIDLWNVSMTISLTLLLRIFFKYVKLDYYCFSAFVREVKATEI